MVPLQLYCAQEDQHRAVLLADFLNSLGTRCELLTAESAPTASPVLVVWTAAAARTPWLLDLFAGGPDTVALVIDSIALPVRCERAVDLCTWPARSADSQVAGLVRWLESADRSGDFGRAASRKLQKKLQKKLGRKSGAAVARTSVDRTGLGALGVLLLVVALVVGVAMQEDTPETVAQPQQERDVGVVPSTAMVPGASGSTPSSKAPSSKNGAAMSGSLLESEGSALEIGLEAMPLPLDEAPAEPPPPPPDARSSLAHLCRAQSPAAALAWYRVLNRAQLEQANGAVCVRGLLARPGYEALGELIAQT